MELNDVVKMCKRLNAQCYVTTTVRGNGTMKTEYSFWGIDRKHVSEAMRMLGISKMDKEFAYGDEDWTHDNIKFNEVRSCKIVGYKEEVVPKHTKKTPIYDCTEK